MVRLLFITLTIMILCQCQRSQTETAATGNKHFTRLGADQCGIDFRNDVPYSDSFNCYVYRNFYNGGGVAIGDLNNDQLPDIFFCSNAGSNKCYLNQGQMRFEDCTDAAGLNSQGCWTAGVAMVDINADGWLDIYITKSGPPGNTRRHNELFINTTAEKGGKQPAFREASAEYGLNFTGLSTHAAFFDYDRDGDLDCYLLNNSIRSVGGYDLRPGQRLTPDPNGGNKLLRNETISKDKPGQRFTDVTQEAGIYASAIGFGLGVTVGDYDRDGWQDLFISNDFFERDYLYHNLGNGKFEEVLESVIPEISKGSMGADMADLNNDGWPEIFVTEMTPTDEKRYKTKAAFDNWNTYEISRQAGYHRQFGRNVLQMNLGPGAGKNASVNFAEVGREVGVWATDWSWGALLADFDNDGKKDIFVANGIGKDLLDQDYLNFYSDPAAVRDILMNNPGEGIKKLIDKMPSQPLPNFLFKNEGEGNDLMFKNVATDWGLEEPSFSNGSAYGDLDNDGDLDLVVNNVNMPCFVYRNETGNAAHWLNIRLNGTAPNTRALGAKVNITVNGQEQFQELAPMRGFESCVDPTLHFGLGSATEISRLEVVFLSGKKIIREKVPADQILTLNESDAVETPIQAKATEPTIFQSASAPGFTHRESTYSDFDREPLLYHMISAEGPAFATADVNGDGLQDFYVGGAAGQAGQLFTGKANGQYAATTQRDFEKDKAGEDSDAAFFDADGDGDADLYVGSGSNEFDPGNPALDDRLYLNDGRGGFKRSPDALPAQKPFATACVRPADVDGDGDLDVFVGMRMIPGHYGQSPRSFILENDGKGRFSPAMNRYPSIAELGMVTDACWTDLDNDNDPDLITVGDWEPVRIFINGQGELTEIQQAVPNSAGWWNHIQVADLNADGRPDFVLGNWGLNSRFKASEKQPLSLFVADFDQNGRDESILCQYNGDKQYPVVQRNDLTKQMPSLKKKYLEHEKYAGQTITDIFTPEQLTNALEWKTVCLESSVLMNQGNLHFERLPLPRAAQHAPVYASAVADFTGDGHADILLAGNHERCKPESGTYLASRGCLLVGDGQGHFREIPARQSGLSIQGVVRALSVKSSGKKGELLVVKNDGPMERFTW